MLIMSKLRIFIEGKELDSLETVTVPITKQFEELSDPTVICNDYSKTVTVPLSKNNNEIFGHCYNPDRLIVAGDEDTPLIGVYFDPYKKLDCRLQWGDDVFFTGYAKMLKVTNKGYEVTINGELGKIFQELQKITFDKTKYEDSEDIEKYWIDGSKYVDTVINKELVYNCWNSEQDDYNLRETTDSEYDVTDIIGFLPNNSFSDDFNYDTYQTYDSDLLAYKDTTFEDYLETAQFGTDKDETFQEYTNISPDGVIGDGLLPEQKREWRSYNQIPFIYWNKYWQIFQKKAEALTGYTWELDSSWFNQTNKNYSQTAVTLLARDVVIKNSEEVKDTDFELHNADSVSFNLKSNLAGDSNWIYLNGGSNTLCPDGYFHPEDGTITVKLRPTLYFHINNDTGYVGNSFGFRIPHSGDASIADQRYGALRLQIVYGDIGSYEVLYDTFITDKSDDSYNIYKKFFPNADIIQVAQQAVTIAKDAYFLASIVFDKDIYIRITKDLGNHKLSYIVTPWALGPDSTSRKLLSENVFFIGTSDGYKYPDHTARLDQKTQSSGDDVTWRKTFFRSGDKFSLNDICNIDFSNILDYCKRYRINIYTDELNKKLVFTKSLFNNYSIVDKTDKIDKSSTFEVSPITFEKKNILFSYNTNETQLSESYQNIYGYPYGAKNLKTSYEFNNDTETLFDSTNEGMIYTPTYLYWSEFSQQLPNIVYQVFNNNFLEVRDSDNKLTTCDNIWFVPTKKVINSEEGTYISDDTNLMSRLNIYSYTDNSNSEAPHLLTTYWTTPDISYNIWEKPKKVFTLDKSWVDSVEGLYNLYWKKYIDERYNIQNKKVTTYVRLSS